MMKMAIRIVFAPSVIMLENATPLTPSFNEKSKSLRNVISSNTVKMNLRTRLATITLFINKSSMGMSKNLFTLEKIKPKTSILRQDF